MGSNEQKFKYDSNYKPEANFTRVKFGHDIPVLETELNEVQILQEKARTSLTRRLVPSGFIELVEKEFDGSSILYNPIENGITKFNHIAIAPSRTIINGYELTLEGNFIYDKYNNYVLVDLGQAPSEVYREDLVYLEVWFQNLTSNDNVREFGYSKGNYIGYQMIDPRVNAETSRRIAMCWDIKVAKGINFNLYPDGLGYTNTMSYSNVMAKANGSLTPHPSLLYMSATNETFKNCEFYKDPNLYIAGRPDTIINSLSIYDKYIFALPLFRVTRRNSNKYSIENFNGAISLKNVNDIQNNNSAIIGDLANNIRPDKLYYDVIDERDILDLRRTINIKEFKQHYYLDKATKDLFSGDLQTKAKNKMRRVQFGVKDIDFTTNSMVKFNTKFNGALDSFVRGQSSPNYTTTGNIIYKDSLNGYGLYLDGTNQVTYSLYDVLNVNRGTMDFYFQPYWYGPEEDVNQTIFIIKDLVGNPVFTLEKKGKYLLWSQCFDVIGSTDPSSKNSIQVDLSNTLLMAKNIYHIRLSWSSDESILESNIYVNGKLVGPGFYKENLLDERNYLLQIGNIEELNSAGFVIENITIYDAVFENEMNEYWPGLPQDVIYGDSLLLPSFNSTLNNFSDNGTIQTTTSIIEADGEPVDGVTTFTFKIPYGKDIDVSEPVKVYNTIGNEVDGIWVDLDTDIATFSTTESVTKIVIQYNLIVPPGNGGYDLPNEILAAGIVTMDDDNNTTLSEVSYCRKDSSDPRQVSFIKPRLINGTYDTAFDYPTNRSDEQCFARLLHYHLNGNGTNEYNIPRNLYGYEVIGIMEVTNRKLTRCTKINSDTISFNIQLQDRVLEGDIIQFKLALGGITFDYETQSKTLVSNIHTTKIIEFTANGIDDTYVLPCYDNNITNGGIVKATLTFTDNTTDGSQTKHKVYFRNNGTSNDMFLPVYQTDLNDPNIKYLIGYELATYELDQVNDSFGTPFLRVKLNQKPKDGEVIQIPVLVSYQPPEYINLSIWYNHIPYQGILSNEPKKLRRLSDWKYFITTLSSGNINYNVDKGNIYSLNNIVNRLPGGMAYAYTVNGQSVAFHYASNTFINNPNINKQLAFVNDVFFANKNGSLDNATFSLETDFTVSKNAKGFQDGELVIKDKDFSIYLPDSAAEITKYLGMACLVMDEDGELLLFVVGNLVTTPTNVNELKPTYGDLFRIQGIPTTVRF